MQVCGRHGGPGAAGPLQEAAQRGAPPAADSASGPRSPAGVACGRAASGLAAGGAARAAEAAQAGRLRHSVAELLTLRAPPLCAEQPRGEARGAEGEGPCGDEAVAREVCEGGAGCRGVELILKCGEVSSAEGRGQAKPGPMTLSQLQPLKAPKSPSKPLSIHHVTCTCVWKSHELPPLCV
jgi:hypothetical protein